MKKRKLFNTSEYKTVSELREALEGTDYYIHPEMQIKNVIELEINEKISKKDRRAFNNATFDFVVYNNNSIPEFVIEFDGPCHSEPKKRQADYRKNIWCSLADLPILRIDDSFIAKYEKTTFLKFIVDRFVSWRTKSETIIREIEERVSFAESISDVDYGDPWNDPSVVFDLTHRFPASVEIATRLFENHKIVSNYLDDKTYHSATNNYPWVEFRRDRMGGGPIGDYARRVERTYKLERIYKKSNGKIGVEKIHELTTVVDYKWGAPTCGRYDINRNLEIPTVIFQGIPGTSVSELSDHFCDYLALDKLEKVTKKCLATIKD
ncbi:DUF2726 domain-containing protein [Desulfobacula toluolica]|uniref:DUF2726 domain-containing protein n=1 Tax=Desulfobacula toluolica (strain DSM 7467 / Tol2) TaxID=651182 RepID=K0NHJ4_DESTT|nr:DUF2726 domain-containing protein [Desulfobacula toluolica]CCK80761.1 uncharacterized protein TOL2_C26020 [Desulfobacula toluolica Tol2]